MRKLSIEEKAKRYDEALKVLHKYDGANIMFTQDLKEEMFPELKESEDDRMKKLCISVVKQFAAVCRKEDKYLPEVEKCIAWLEKQGEQKPAEDSCKKSDGITSEEKDMTEYNKGFECGKQRVLKYPEDFGLCKKPAWNKEDRDYYDTIIEKLEVTQEDALLTDNQIEFLKSLKDRVGCEVNCTTTKEWKPSEEQMKALTFACIKNVNIDKSSIKALYDLKEQLKKLRE